MQIVNKFYSNMVNTSQNRLDVIVRGTQVQYLKVTLKIMLGVKGMEDSY